MRVAAGVVIVGALLQVPTILVVSGHVSLLAGDSWVDIDGYGVLPGSSFRKAVIVTRSAAEMTSLFPTAARTVEDAEREMTAEHNQLMSRSSETDTIRITGE